ncbi:cytochrome c biogenesis protein ResB [Isosphaeraceae bacterium EP7]
MATSMTDPKTAAPARPGMLNSLWLACDAIYRFLASLKLAVISLSSLSAVLAYATFYESWHGTAAVQEQIYQSAGFAVLLAFLAANILCAATIRFPWKRRQAGFVVTHAGLLILIAGSYYSFRTSREGQVALEEATQSSQLMITDHPILRVRPIDAHTGQATEEVELAFRPGVFAWKPGRFETLTREKDPFTVALKAHLPASLPSRVVVDATGGSPSLKLLALAKPPGAAEAVPMFRSESESWFMVAPSNKLSRVSRVVGPARISFQFVTKPEMVEDFLNPPKELGPNGAARFRYKDKTGKDRVYDLPVDGKGAASPFQLPDSDLTVSFQRMIEFPTAIEGREEESSEFYSMVGDDEIPIVEYSIKKGDGPALRHMGWGMLPTVPSFIPDPEDKSGTTVGLAAISYYSLPKLDGSTMMSRRGVIEVMGDSAGKLFYRTFGLTEGNKGVAIRASGTLPLGESVLGMGGDKMPMTLTFKAERYLQTGIEKTVCEELNLPVGQKGNGIPAALVEMKVNGVTREFWARRSISFDQNWQTIRFPDQSFQVCYDFEREPLGFHIDLDDFDVKFDPGTEQASSFTSKIRLTDEARKIKDRPVTISMNEPMEHRGLTFYQSSYIRSEDPATLRPTGKFQSVFQVAEDPGRRIKYAGSLLVVLGTFMQFYMRSGVYNLTRRRVKPADIGGSDAPDVKTPKTKPAGEYLEDL